MSRTGIRAYAPVLHVIVAAMILVGCSACVAIDSFGSRASTFNDATATSKSDSILTNIVRATFAEPLQFTDIVTAQGTALADGSITAAFPIPFRGGFGVPLAQQFISPQPSLRLNGGNQFNLTNLNSQEFYNGLQAPLNTQQVVTFLLNNFDADILLMMALAEIEFEAGGRRAVLRNNASSPFELKIFYTAVANMLRAGLSGEVVDDGSAVGPRLTDEEAKDLLPDLVRATATDALILRKAQNGGFQLTKKGSVTRFCFDNIKMQGVKPLGRDNLYLAERVFTPRSVQLTIPAVPEATVQLNPGDFCGAARGQAGTGNVTRSLRFRYRSVEGMFQYLGAIVRGQLGYTNGVPTDYTINGSYNLFRLFQGEGDGTFAISHRGERYGIVTDMSGQFDGSSRILQLLTSLLALQSSAKNFPSQNLVTVVGN